MELYSPNQMRSSLISISQRVLDLKDDLAKMRRWYDRISTNSDDNAAATALENVITADGYTITHPEALLFIKAMREMTFWGATFAPTFTLDISGPNI